MKHKSHFTTLRTGEGDGASTGSIVGTADSIIGLAVLIRKSGTLAKTPDASEYLTSLTEQDVFSDPSDL
jgi:hypothetical protein